MKDKEFCWKHQPGYVVVKKKGSKNKKSKKELEVEVVELRNKVDYLTALIDGMKMMKV